MLTLEKTHRLAIVEINAKGTYVDGGGYGSVFLRKAPESAQIGDKVTAFLYADSDGKGSEDKNNIVAIFIGEKEAHAKIGECAYLKVVSVGDHGAFLDWGLPKDLLLPYPEQAFPVKQGDSCVVYITNDDNNRAVATTLLYHHLDEEGGDLREGDAVDLLIASKSDLGFKAVINNTYLGLIFHEELSQPLRFGSRMKGWVKQIREDGKIDLSINTLDKKTRDQLESKILTQLQKEGGRLMLSDKSSPESIFKAFSVSKKNFKRALGSLYKQRLIKIESDYIELV
jgi:predicted RNA-binding protein (virulence factor B family)